jgi:hypothetical protein
LSELLADDLNVTNTGTRGPLGTCGAVGAGDAVEVAWVVEVGLAGAVEVGVALVDALSLPAAGAAPVTVAVEPDDDAGDAEEDGEEDVEEDDGDPEAEDDPDVEGDDDEFAGDVVGGGLPGAVADGLPPLAAPLLLPWPALLVDPAKFAVVGCVPVVGAVADDLELLGGGAAWALATGATAVGRTRLNRMVSTVTHAKTGDRKPLPVACGEIGCCLFAAALRTGVISETPLPIDSLNRVSPLARWPPHEPQRLPLHRNRAGRTLPVVCATQSAGRRSSDRKARVKRK